MTEPKRWIATVDSKGELQEIKPYTGYADDGSATLERSDGTFHCGIAGTEEDAESRAVREWRFAQDDPFPEYHDIGVVCVHIQNSTDAEEIEAIWRYEATGRYRRSSVFATCENQLSALALKNKAARNALVRARKWFGDLGQGGS